MVISITPPLAINWTKDLELGIDVIDEQHKRIVDYINDLYIARFNNDIEGIKTVLELMVDFTQYHFQLEESLMERANFSGFEEHKKDHQKLIEEVNGYVFRFMNNEDISGALQSMMMNWLIGHIKRDDAKYADVVKKMLAEEVEEVNGCDRRHGDRRSVWSMCKICTKVKSFFTK